MLNMFPLFQVAGYACGMDFSPEMTYVYLFIYSKDKETQDDITCNILRMHR